MQVLIRFDTTDPDAFLGAFADASERRDQAGLSQLQLWREDGGTAVWGLFRARDREATQDWLTAEEGVRPELTGSQVHFLQTV